MEGNACGFDNIDNYKVKELTQQQLDDHKKEANRLTKLGHHLNKK